jgi:CBS domain-containing protein
MKVAELMSRPVETCRLQDSLNLAAQRMWDHDCGSVPVVDDNGIPLGMVTDRDICMAAYTQGKPLSAIAVSTAMSHAIYTCAPTDSVAAAEKLMAAKQVRRLPVVDKDGRLVGLLSLHDIATRGSRLNATRLGRILAAIASPQPLPATAWGTAGDARRGGSL